MITDNWFNLMKGDLMNIDEFLTRSVEEAIVKDSLREKLASGKKLRIKYGVDPTRPDIHLGHAVGLWKLRELQDAGHTVIFLIGDFTTKIGDPSGRNTTRPVLTDEEIKANAKTYFDQVGKILDIEKTEVRYNSEWFSKMNFNDILKLSGQFTVAQIVERDDFAKRLKEGTDIGLHEILYPLMQAYDSVELKADVEFGGLDQKFNMLAGRELQKKMGQAPQDVLMLELLVGTDGKIKMSKSAGNYIAITDPANDMFGKIMSIPDEAMPQYFELCTNMEMPKNENPRDTKIQLAKEIVKIYHGEKEAEEAEAEFDRVHKNKELPTVMDEVKIGASELNIVDIIVEAKLAVSKSDARRLVEQGGVSINDERIDDPQKEIKIESGLILKVGKRNFVRIEKQ